LKRIPWEQDILLFVGALTVGKGLQALIGALPEVLRSRPETHLLIVGSGAYREVLEALVYALSKGKKELLLKLCDHGYDLDRNEFFGPWEDIQGYLADPANLERLMDEGSGVDRHIHFLGRLDHARLRHLFPCADLSVFPSVVPEAYPLVIMESLSNGVLPLVSDFSGFTDSVDELEPELGRSITDRMRIPAEGPERMGELAANIVSLLSDETLRNIGPTLRKIAVDRYDWSLRTEEMLAAWASLHRDR
jgi:glycosyltransferase involved in cell wall biosynthesis